MKRFSRPLLLVLTALFVTWILLPLWAHLWHSNRLRPALPIGRFRILCNIVLVSLSRRTCRFFIDMVAVGCVIAIRAQANKSSYNGPSVRLSPYPDLEFLAKFLNHLRQNKQGHIPTWRVSRHVHAPPSTELSYLLYFLPQ
jgi:hypothetical protein